MQKSAALCCVEGNEQKVTHLWKQIPEGTPLASNILVHLLFLHKSKLQEFFAFLRMQKTLFWTRLKVHVVQILSLTLSDLESTLFSRPDQNHIFVIYCM